MKKIPLVLLLLLLPLNASAFYVNPTLGHLTHRQQLITTDDGPLALNLALYYSSVNREGAPLGPRWTHSYDIVLHQNSDKSLVFIGGFEDRHFLFYGINGYGTATGELTKFHQNQDGTWTVELNNGKKYYFNLDRKLKKIRDKADNTVKIDRSTPETVIITDPQNRQAIIKYSGDRIESIESPDRKKFQFSYDQKHKSRTLKSITGPIQHGLTNIAPCWEFKHTPDNHLELAKDPDGNITKFVYTDDRVTRMIAPGGVLNMSGKESEESEEYSIYWEYHPEPNNRLVGETKIRYGASGLIRTYKYNRTREYFSTFELPEGEKATRTFYDDVPIIETRYRKLKELISPGPNGEKHITKINSYDHAGNPTEIRISTVYPDGREELKDHSIYKYNEKRNIISVLDVPTGKKHEFPHGIPSGVN